MSIRQKRFIIIAANVLAGCAFLFGLLFDFAPSILERNSTIAAWKSSRIELQMTAQMRSTFSQQSKLFMQPLASIGVIGHPRTLFECYNQVWTRTTTTTLCTNFLAYHYSFSPMSPSVRNSFPANAAHFDALLKQNGWVNDRPQDAVTTIAGSDPYAPGNGGLGGDVPFHKNVGDISCNMEVDVSGLKDPVSPNTVNLNTFSCSQTITFSMYHSAAAVQRGI